MRAAFLGVLAGTAVAFIACDDAGPHDSQEDGGGEPNDAGPDAAPDGGRDAGTPCVTEIATESDAIGVAISGDLVFVGESGGGAEVFDLDSGNRRLAFIGVEQPTTSLTVMSGAAYLASGTTLRRYDASPLGEFLALAEGTTDGGEVLDFITPAPDLSVVYALAHDPTGTPGWLGFDAGAGISVNALATFRTDDVLDIVAADQRTLVVARGDVGVTLFDIAYLDPPIPQVTAAQGTLDSLAFDGTYVYAAGSVDLLVVATDGGILAEIPHGIAGGVAPGHMAAAGGSVFIAAEQEGIVVVDATTPESPRLATSVADAAPSRHVAIWQGSALVAAGARGLLRVDRSCLLLP